MAGAFGAPGVAGEVGSSGSSSNALPAVAFEEILVPRVGSSLAPSASVPGGDGGSVLVDGEGPSSPRGLIRDTSFTRTCLGQGGALTSSIILCPGCGRRRNSCCTSISSR